MKPYTASLTQQAAALVYDIRQRINPQYADQRGTESYERKECADMIDALRERLAELEQDNQHLSDELTLLGKVSKKLMDEIGGHPV